MSGPPKPAGGWHQVPYAEASYWEARYGKEHQPFEWFLGYTALRRVLRAFLSKRKPVLQIGCGTSNVQEGMAKAGWSIHNVDIAKNIIDKLTEQHKDIPGLTYAVGDCRDMPEYMDCQFGGVLDKGTVDALLCSKDGVSNVTRMFSEASRVLTPGGTFLLISLGDPTRRLCLLCCEKFDWTVQVLLLPKITSESQAVVDGRPVNDTLSPVDFLGPFEVLDAETLVGVPRDVDYSRFFFGYVCKKRRLQLPLHPEQRQRLPNGWVRGSRAIVAKLQQEMGLPPDLLSRGKRTRTVMRPRTNPTATALPDGTPAPLPGHSLAACSTDANGSDAGDDLVGDAALSQSNGLPPRTRSVPNLAALEGGPSIAMAAAPQACTATPTPQASMALPLADVSSGETAGQLQAVSAASAAVAATLQQLQGLRLQAEWEQQRDTGADEAAAAAHEPAGVAQRADMVCVSPSNLQQQPRAQDVSAGMSGGASGSGSVGFPPTDALLPRPESDAGAPYLSEDASEGASCVHCILESVSEGTCGEEDVPTQPEHAQRVRRHSAPPTEAMLKAMQANMHAIMREPCLPPEPPNKGMQRLAECDAPVGAQQELQQQQGQAQAERQQQQQ